MSIESLRIHSSRTTPAVVRHENAYTLSTLALGVVVGLFCAWLVRRGSLTLGWEIPSTVRFCGEFALLVIAFEAYFYSLHRLFHTRWLYRHVHATHHLSTAPTVRTALAFHPVESFLLLAFMPAMTWLLPLHLAPLLCASAFLTATIAFAHCGYEPFPRRFHEIPVLNWYVTPTVHDRHHTSFRCNFGATLSVFDRLFGTFALAGSGSSPVPESPRDRG